MSTTTDHRIETSGSVSLAAADDSVQGADVKSMPVSQNGLSSELLEELAALAAEKVRGEGLRLMGEGGLLPELAQHLMQAALEAEMDEHLAAEAGRTHCVVSATATAISSVYLRGMTFPAADRASWSKAIKALNAPGAPARRFLAYWWSLWSW
ncbi:hypothetical protein ACWD00_38815 [Streptomyces viridiviolaceus]